ncbi:myelin p0 related [Anaeramoeba ignava]|uniref:Myelin p0 related n=1 Tax=Anaeramoeba ignava TaxID=1746090 RepID=A0A9Q0LUF3_ANAIG|nr:myelin p0 related [Anaeramoeba ignava]
MKMLLLLELMVQIKYLFTDIMEHFWNQEQNLYESASNFGESFFQFMRMQINVSVYENVIVIGALIESQAFIYRYNGTFWNKEQNLNGPLYLGFGRSVSIYGNFTNEEQILSEPLWFGYSVSIYENVTVIGTNSINEAFIYRYNGTFWNQEQNLNESASYFGYSVSIYENYTVIGTDGANRAFVYKFKLIPQVNIINCSSLFSSFDCYWDEIQIPNLKYQINYGYDWIDIDSPILEDENIYYQQFNSSIYDNITGNEYYSIQIHACNPTTMKCGESSSFINLTSKIDSVKDFQLSNPSNNSINVTWNYPNVQIDEGIAHLDHYNLSYLNQSQPDLISFISVDNSSLDYLLNNFECENDYNISICGCRTQECEGDDKGEIVESSISLLFGEVTNLTCSISNSIDINCNWNQPINCSIPFYYNLTYQSIYQNDSGNYQPTSLNQQFTVQFPNQEYQINISACNSNGKCGYISSISIKTDNLTSPTIYETISKIEEIEFNFTKLTNANNYSISLDNGTNWQKFTSLDLNGNEVIGIISEISGNIEYNISIRGCADLNCEISYLGEPSSIISTRAKLGNITSLNCYSLINGFICSWDPLILSSGLKSYSFKFNSISICLTNLINYYSITSGLEGGEYYEISVYSSADLNCLNNEYSGINSTTSITILSPYQPTQSTDSNNSNTTAITIGMLIPIIIILIVIIAILLYQKKTKTKKQKQTKNLNQKQEEKELQDDLDI